MRKIIIGLISLLIVICVVFNYSRYFDYTYDNTVYEIDFIKPSKINASHIEKDIFNVYSAGNSVITILSSLFNTLTFNYFSNQFSDLTDSEKEFFEWFDKMCEYSLKEYIPQNFSYLNITNWYDRMFTCDNYLNDIKTLVYGDLIIYPDNSGSTYSYNFHLYSGDKDIYDSLPYIGWSERDIERLHEYCVENKRNHTYKGTQYFYH